MGRSTTKFSSHVGRGPERPPKSKEQRKNPGGEKSKRGKKKKKKTSPTTDSNVREKNPKSNVKAVQNASKKIAIGSKTNRKRKFIVSKNI